MLEKDVIKYLDMTGTPFGTLSIPDFKKIDKFHITTDGEIQALALVKKNLILHFSVLHKRRGLGEELMRKIKRVLEPSYNELIAWCPMYNIDYAYFLEDIGFRCNGEYLYDILGYVFIYEISPTPVRRPKQTEKSPDNPVQDIL